MHTYGACRMVSMRTINLFRTAVKSYRRGRIQLGRGLLGSSFIYNLMFFKMDNGCMGVAFFVPLSRSEICPNLKKNKHQRQISLEDKDSQVSHFLNTF